MASYLRSSAAHHHLGLVFKSALLASMQKTYYDISNIKQAKLATLFALFKVTYNINVLHEMFIQRAGLGKFLCEGITREHKVGYSLSAMPERNLLSQDLAKENHGKRYQLVPVFYAIPRNIINKIYFRLALSAQCLHFIDGVVFQ